MILVLLAACGTPSTPPVVEADPVDTSDTGAPVDTIPSVDTDDTTTDTACEEERWYADDDGDGYGDADTRVEACEAPQGHVPVTGDCDDTRADIHAYADEVCGDGIDQDCYDGDLACTEDTGG